MNSTWKNYLITAGIAVLAVYVYNTFIAANFKSLPTA